jgi:aryl-alcohol dehydrogenase-like predicted oxidoreductase
MEQREIGELRVSVVGVGCNNFGMRIDEDATARVVNEALEAGVNFFDTADVYGGTRSEEFLGRALGSRRDEAVVATKFGAPLGDDKAGAKPAYVRAACEDSLRRLGTDRIDLYQLHFPDAGTPLEDTLAALHELVDAGKVVEIGCSNFSPELIGEATRAARARKTARFVSVQNHLNLLHRDEEAGLVEACADNGLVILPYFPLASGLLTGKYKAGEEPPEGTRLAAMPAERRERFLNEPNLETVGRLEAYARDRGHTLLELAMSWLAGVPGLASVIAGATRPEQVRSNVEAATAWRLSDEERADIDDITGHGR